MGQAQQMKPKKCPNPTHNFTVATTHRRNLRATQPLQHRQPNTTAASQAGREAKDRSNLGEITRGDARALPPKAAENDLAVRHKTGDPNKKPGD